MRENKYWDTEHFIEEEDGFKHGEPYWTIEGEGEEAKIVEHTYSDDIGLDGMAERDGYEERYYLNHRHAFLALQRIKNTP